MRTDVYYTEWTNQKGWRYRLYFYPASVNGSLHNYVLVPDECILSVNQSQKFDSLPVGRPDAGILKVTFNLNYTGDDLASYILRPFDSDGSGGTTEYQFLRDVAETTQCTNGVVLYTDQSGVAADLLTWQVEFVGVQLKTPSQKLKPVRKGATTVIDNIEIEFIDIVKAGLEHSPLTNCNVTNGAFSPIWGAHDLITNSVFNIGVFKNAEDWKFEDTGATTGFGYGNIGGRISKSSLYACLYKFETLWDKFQTMFGYACKSLNTSVGTANFNEPNFGTDGVKFYHQGATILPPSGDPLDDAITSDELYILGHISTSSGDPFGTTDGVPNIIGGALGEMKGSWSDLDNLWNLFAWLSSALGYRMRWDYSVSKTVPPMSSAIYTTNINVYLENIFDKNALTIDTLEHFSTVGQLPEIDIGGEAIRSTETHYKMRQNTDSETFTHEKRGSDAEDNVTFELWLHNVPTRLYGEYQEASIYTTANGREVRLGFDIYNIETVERNVVAMPVGVVVRVYENGKWNMGEGIEKFIIVGNQDKLQRSTTAGTGVLLAQAMVDVFGRYEQATVEMQISYASTPFYTLGQGYTITTNLPAAVDYIGDTAILVSLDVDHVTGTAKSKFLIVDLTTM